MTTITQDATDVVYLASVRDAEDRDQNSLMRPMMEGNSKDPSRHERMFLVSNGLRERVEGEEAKVFLEPRGISGDERRDQVKHPTAARNPPRGGVHAGGGGWLGRNRPGGEEFVSCRAKPAVQSGVSV